MGRYGLVCLIKVLLKRRIIYSYQVFSVGLVGMLLVRIVCLVQVDIKLLVKIICLVIASLDRNEIKKAQRIS